MTRRTPRDFWRDMVALLAPVVAAIALAPGGFQHPMSTVRPRMPRVHSGKFQRSPAPSASISIFANNLARELSLWPAAISKAPAALVHDYFNIACISGLVALTCATTLHAPLNLQLAVAIVTYTSIDTIWVMCKPEAVEEPRSLIGHHLMAIVVALHAATYAPHTHFTSWMSVVEISTLCAPSPTSESHPHPSFFFDSRPRASLSLSARRLLMIKRHVPEGLKAPIELAFKITWVASRVLWFPILAVHLSMQTTWPSAQRRIVCSACCYGLALLQWVWTARGEKAEDATMRLGVDAP